MRRWLTLFLLVLLPFQISWNAATAYDRHQASNDARHFGHHAHVHAHALGDAAQLALDQKPVGAESAKIGKTLADADCGYCHFGSFVPGTAMPEAAPNVAVRSLAGPAKLAFTTRMPDHPDRPNWRIA